MEKLKTSKYVDKREQMLFHNTCVSIGIFLLGFIICLFTFGIIIIKISQEKKLIPEKQSIIIKVKEPQEIKIVKTELYFYYKIKRKDTILMNFKIISK